MNTEYVLYKQNTWNSKVQVTHEILHQTESGKQQNVPMDKINTVQTKV